MKIAVYNFKGGVGKTSISLNIALKLDLPVVTNDQYSPLERLLKKENFIKLEKEQLLPEFKKEHSLLFDFGGYADKRISKISSMSDHILIPTTNEFLNIQSTINTVKELEKFNKNILVIANRAKKGDLEKIKTTLNNLGINYPIFEIKESKAMQNMLIEQKPIAEMIEEGGLKAYNFQKINKQFDSIINFLDRSNDQQRKSA